MLEINEISWELMEPWLGRGELPHFQRLREGGSWARSHADERPPLLEPWITWTTVFTGVPQGEHGMEFLEQPTDSLRAKRIWDIVNEAGKKVGVFGSVGSWPPSKVDGFFVPGSFSPDSQTYPEHLRPIQDLNLRYTRAHAPGTPQPRLGAMVVTGAKLWTYGLRFRMAWAILKTLLETRLHPDRAWKKVSLQPLLNFAFFRRLFHHTQPDFATFHTNHVAHYQHRFLRAYKPQLFPDSTDPKEIRTFGDAIHFGYVVADQLLGQVLDLCRREKNVVLCVGSSMGQKPWVPERYGKIAPPTCRIRSIERLVDVLGIKKHCEFFSTMAPQWNLRIGDEGIRKSTVQHLHAARYQPLGKSMYAVLEVKDCLVVTPVSHHGLGETARCSFPSLQGAPTFPFEEFVIQADETRKSGCHDPIGMLCFYGPPIRPGVDLGEVNNLDIAPTLLSLMGMPVPSCMKGKVLKEAFIDESTSLQPSCVG